jgi:hypothetical protein
VDVALERIAFTTDHERELPVSLKTQDAVDDVYARVVQLPSPLDVMFLVETRL